MHEISVDTAIFTTRSMRHLSNKPVPKEDLEYIVEAATMAPSAGNYQMWAFVAVTDKSLITQISAAYKEAGTAYVKDIVLADPNTDDERRRVYTQAMYTVDHLHKAPAIVVACLTQPTTNDMNVASGLFGSIYPAIQNLILAARSKGLGSVLLTLATDYSPIKPEKNREVRDILELPEGVSSVAIVPIGYPTGDWGRPKRDPVLAAM